MSFSGNEVFAVSAGDWSALEPDEGVGMLVSRPLDGFLPFTTWGLPFACGLARPCDDVKVGLDRVVDGELACRICGCAESILSSPRDGRKLSGRASRSPYWSADSYRLVMAPVTW